LKYCPTSRQYYALANTAKSPTVPPIPP
jgi:hypothetical protein